MPTFASLVTIVRRGGVFARGCAIATQWIQAPIPITFFWRKRAMATSSKSYVKHSRRAVALPALVPAAKSYIKFPSPLRSRATSNWRVADLCAAYQVPQGRCPGGGVIGILELGGGWTQTDLDKFSNNNGLPPITVTDVPLPGGANSPGQAADAEVLLDIEVAAAVYYYATGTMPTIKMFWAPNDFSSFEAVVKAAVAAGCDVLSISWGADEKRWEQAAPGAAQALEDAIAQAAESGLLVFAASGDNASGDLDPGANVDMPSACPHIIGCGGTTKFPGTEEKVWGHGKPDGEGTGGGFSNIFPMPQWQLDNNAPAGPPLNPNRTRMVPDVAANADPQTGYLVVINGQETPIGGTSAVAPFYAGLFAAFGPKLGFIGQTLWQNPTAFTDIVTGSNGGFSARRGRTHARVWACRSVQPWRPSSRHPGPTAAPTVPDMTARCRSGSEAGWPIMSSWWRLRAARLGRLWHASAAQATRVLPSGTAMA